ncbi:MAG: Na+/H+ antiporter NhaD-like permease [bacterium]|nr:MAG: Na+/H+ antiporter NhaD-like permease [bacterium]KAF0150660.1 MAG: Na+/H+ antiporter NhaD-like permease [bacterium]KAF0169513.1 MAG: Na+/H+ antiporter NhaD-like permease [bacterium]TXT20501.1 MAG: Na+/H+ antiporter NhaD-like permease [bacterium]
MTDLQIIVTLVVFATVVLAIAFDVIDMVLAVLIGCSLLAVLGILEREDVRSALQTASGPLALLFGGMVVARMLAMTGLFERLGALFLRATGGSGKRFLILMVALVAPICALLPNATTVILLAPVIIAVARALRVSFVGPMILAAIISNSAGMLTLVGDPATFLVGSSIGMTFGEYLRSVSLAGLLAVLVIIPLLPRLMPEVWNSRVEVAAKTALPPIERPYFAALALLVLAIMVTLFLFGEELPSRIGPPAVAILAATLALLVLYGARVEPVENVMRDVDWKTLVFLGAIFCLVEAFTKTGLLQGMSLKLHAWFGMEFALVALTLLACIGVLSAVLANIPVVAASLIMTKGYLVAVEAVPEIAMAEGFAEWPAATIPVFIAMMFGATLGGNATLIGASANIVSVGICAREGERVSFMRFMRYGLPITLVQLLVSALYVLAMFWLMR